MSLGDGRDTVTGSGYGNNVTVGTGTDSIDVGEGATIHAAGGTQAITLHGMANMVFIGGSATAAITGSQGSSQITTTAGSASITLAGYSNVVTTGASNDTITDGAGGSAFHVGTGLEVLNQFAANAGSVVYVPAAYAGGLSGAGLFNALTTNGSGSAVLDLAGGGSVVFNGLAPSQLHASNFQIG